MVPQALWLAVQVEETMVDPRYPIGKFDPPASDSSGARAGFIAQIEEAPVQLRQAVRGLSPDELGQSYREGGWTLAQVVHHVADSHVNSYIRFKLAVSADNPLVTAYDETRWAEFPDAVSLDVDVSLNLLDAMHARWLVFLRGLEPAQFARTFQHSALGPVSLDWALALYAWHGRHHTAHITGMRERMGW